MMRRAYVTREVNMWHVAVLDETREFQMYVYGRFIRSIGNL